MDFIIKSTVRANIYGKLWFLKSEKRLNVSLITAKKSLILVGNVKCLAKRLGVFRDLISFYFSNRLIVNDPFKNCIIIIYHIVRNPQNLKKIIKIKIKENKNIENNKI